MPSRNTSIKQVQTFPQLVKYLRDELDWPIESDNYEDISWEYDPEELGLKPNEAAKIDYIRQIRPLTDKQPFGIFFVKFSKGKLPVVALRRILSNLVVKRRASANKAERPAWEMNDLLFLSSWGEKKQRHMNFAHFADNDSRKDLPTLKVLDWAQHNTRLHIRDVEQRLRQNLAWPDDTANRDQWRETWRGAFRLRHRETIDTSKALSIRLAELARAIRDRISDALAIETDKGPLTTLLKAFQQGLVHDLDADGFADMYAQTIAYGLLSARIADPKKKTADDFAAHMRTSPFLRELMETFLAVGGRKGKAGGPGIDFDELGVSDVVELLDEAKMGAVVRDFGDKNRQEDPVIHFYELFLHEYNKQLKIQRGVFYTPQPVVSYIVRSVHELLQTEFGLADGLADTTTWGEMLKKHKELKLPPLTDEPGEKRTVSPKEPFVQILDPATGTATFLVEVIDVIHTTMTAKWKLQGKKAKAIDTLWNDYVPKHLLPRLHAYELMMAPYAIAHMKVGLKLAETGYRFEKEERARVYLTNALEPWQKQLKLPAFDALAHEAAAVNEIKRDKRFTVVIGNPPYSGVSSNRNDWIEGLLKGGPHRARANYYEVDGESIAEKKIWLQDDYVKFIRLSHFLLEQTSAGIHGMITNHSFVDSPTCRGMRSQMLKFFSSLDFIDLHGSTKKAEEPPNGKADENVFDILPGVAISICTRFCSGDLGMVHSFDLWGTKSLKSKWLSRHGSSDVDWIDPAPAQPYFLFVKRQLEFDKEYLEFPSLKDIFPFYGTGIQTSRDKFAADSDRDALEDRLRTFFDLRHSDAKVAETFALSDTRGWKINEVRRSADLNDTFSTITQCAFRPFDNRWIPLTKDIVDWPRLEVMSCVSEGSLGLLCSRQQSTPGFRHALAVDMPVDMFCISNKSREGQTLFPLFARDENDLFSASKGISFRPNLGRSVKERLVSLPPDGEITGEVATDVFHYIYAILYSESYRSRYTDLLKMDFPRLPLTGNLELFRALAKLGGELTALHLLKSPKLKKTVTKFIGKHPVVSKVGWTPDDGGTVWLDGKGTAKSLQPGTSGFYPVPEEVWNFHIGGYQVCEKWLKDRGPKKGKPGRTLTKDDISHYHKIVIALTETIRIMSEIDGVIEQHGGWPGAFVTETEELRKVAEQRGEFSA